MSKDNLSRREFLINGGIVGGLILFDKWINLVTQTVQLPEESGIRVDGMDIISQPLALPLASEVLQPGKWHHVAYQWDRTTGLDAHYIDGVQVEDDVGLISVSPKKATLPGKALIELGNQSRGDTIHQEIPDMTRGTAIMGFCPRGEISPKEPADIMDGMLAYARWEDPRHSTLLGIPGRADFDSIDCGGVYSNE